MSDDRPADPRRRRISRRTAVQLVAVVLGAAFAAGAAMLYSSASGSWQQSVREESLRSSAMQEQIRAVYGEEAPTALRVAAAEAQAQALRPIRNTSPFIAAEVAVAEQMAFTIRQSALPGTLAAGNEYALPSGGFDIHRRIADLTEAGTPNPDRAAAQGDRQARTAQLIAAVTLLLTGTAVAIAALPDRRRQRRRRTPRQRHAADVQGPELVPQPGLTNRGRRRTAVLLLTLWAAGVLLPFAQLILSGDEQRSQAAAARTAVQLGAQTATSLARTAFETNALRDAIMADTASTARELAAIEAPEPAANIQRVLARAEAAAAANLHDIALQMGRAPTPDQPLDPYLSQALASNDATWAAMLRAQNEQADRAGRFGTLANGVIALIALLAAASAVMEVVAHRQSKPPRRRRS